MNAQAHAITFHADAFETARALDLAPESFGPDALRSVGELLRTTAQHAEDVEDAANMLQEYGIEPGEEIPQWMTLSGFLDSTWFNEWQAESDNQLAFRDPERFARNMDAAENGCDGSTHAERLDDMRRALRDFADDEPLLPYNREYMLLEVEKAWQWHELSGTLDESGA